MKEKKEFGKFAIYQRQWMDGWMKAMTNKT
jgi:hypothetical protein